MARANSDFIIGELRVDQPSVYQSQDFTHWIISGQRPVYGGETNDTTG